MVIVMARPEMVKNYLETLDLHNRELDFSFLEDIVARHVATFAFSSLGVQLNENLPLEFKSLYQRIIIQRRGGYCFEHNGLLFGILEELGFFPELFLARVIHNKDIHPGLTHRITIVEIEGRRYVLDVGFGVDGPRIPVPMSGVASSDGERVFRIAERRPGEYHMQVFRSSEFFSLYRFELALYGQSDCEIGHFYSHRHPDAIFVNHLVASLLLKSETRSLLGLEYRLISNSGTQSQNINSSEQLKCILVDELGVQVTDNESRRLFEKTLAQSLRLHEQSESP
ncbi:MAG: N-hydroxyarylamine O-acetyltransferase [Desulforhopalus sp.]|jgi:N-hydroxyarylamine O-acetyltransferase